MPVTAMAKVEIKTTLHPNPRAFSKALRQGALQHPFSAH